jgi:transcriptional regulator with XRE-family HTH domain
MTLFINDRVDYHIASIRLQLTNKCTKEHFSSMDNIETPVDGKLLEEVGQRVRAVREKARLTQQEFADILGCSRRQLAKIEDAQATPSIWNLRTIRAKFDIDPEWIIEGPGINPRAHARTQEWDRYDRLVSDVRKLGTAYGMTLPEKRIHEFSRIVFEEAPELEKDTKAIIARVIRTIATTK